MGGTCGMTGQSPFAGRGSSPRARRGLDGTVWGLLAEALALPTGIVTVVLLTRRLGPDGYGLFILAASLIIWLQVSISAFLARTTVAFISHAEDWRPVGAAVVRLYLLLGLGVAVLVWLSAPILAAGLGEPERLPLYIRLFTLDLLLSGLADAHRQILIGLGRFRPSALGRAARWIGRLMLIALLVELGLSIPGAIIGSLAAAACELLVARYYIRPAILGRLTVPLWPFLRFSAPLLLSGIALRLLVTMDLFALKAMGGTATDAGHYAAAQNLALVPGLFALAFSPVLLSSLSHALHLGDHIGARALGRDALRIAFGVLPFVGLSAGAAPEIVRLIYGVEFEAAAPLLAMLFMAGVGLLLMTIAANILVALGKPQWTMVYTVPLVPLALIGHLLVIPHAGAPGAALVTVTSAMVGAAAGLLAVHNRWRLQPPIATATRSLLIALLALGIAMAWPTSGAMVVVKLAVISVGIAVIYRLLGEFTADELAFIGTILRRPALSR
jgi:O-antigen/teichoic acid export membrane protein